MTTIDYVPRIKGSQFTGSNFSEIVALVQTTCGQNPYFLAELDAGASSAANCVVNIKDDTGVIFNMIEVAANGWVVAQGNTIVGAGLSTAQMTQFYRSFTETMTTLGQTSSGSAFGSAPAITVPGLSNANFDITIRPSMPGTAYTAVPCLVGSSTLLGALSITNVTSGVLNAAGKLNGSTVRVNVANSGVAQLAGAAILVHVTP